MEALALYEFTASGEDELSFKKGDILKILGSDDNWYKAELQGSDGYVPKNYVEAQFPRWYCEGISRAEAESTLMARHLGSFIMRTSQTSKGEFSISVRHEEDVQHFKVMRDPRGNYYLWTEKFKSLNKLVEHYKTSSISRQKHILLREDGPHTQEKQIEKSTRENSRLVGGAMGEPQSTPTSHRSYTGPEKYQHLETSQDTHRGVPENSRLRNTWPAPLTESNRTVAPHATSPARLANSQATYAAQHAPFSCRPLDQTPIPRINRSQSTSLPRMQLVQALYDFQAMESDELGFQSSDIIEVLDSSDSSWWMGRLRGRIGLFPSNYVASIDR